MQYYATIPDDDPLQGDGWRDVDWFQLESQSIRKARTFVLSNSCDVATSNERELPANITLAQLVRLQKLIEILRSENVTEQVIADKVAAIRRQDVSNVFYLPNSPGTDDEYVVLLDNVQSQPLTRFLSTDSRRRIFSLSQAGWWVLLIKLAGHFCRMQEGMHRGYQSA